MLNQEGWMMANCVSVIYARYPALLDCAHTPFFDRGDGVIHYLPSRWPAEMTVAAPTVEQVNAWILEDGD